MTYRFRAALAEDTDIQRTCIEKCMTEQGVWQGYTCTLEPGLVMNTVYVTKN